MSSIIEIEGREYKLKKCLKCGRIVFLERFLFLCNKCRKSNLLSFDWNRYIDHSRDKREVIIV